MGKNKEGRPTVMTKETVNKLEEVFAIGGTDEEACFYADISRQTLYDYQKLHPEYVDRKDQLKQRPILKARQTIVRSLDNAHDAQWFLTRKRKIEFGDNMDVTSGGKPIPLFDNVSSNNINSEDKKPK